MESYRAKASLNVSLTSDLTTYLTSPVCAGRYRSPSEVVRAGLRLLRRQKRAGRPLQRRSGFRAFPTDQTLPVI